MGGHIPAVAGAGAAGAAITAATTAAIGLDQDSHFARIDRTIPGLYTDRHRISTPCVVLGYVLQHV